MTDSNPTLHPPRPKPAPEPVLIELLALIGRTPSLVHGPEQLLQRAPALPETARFAQELRQQVYGSPGYALVALDDIPSAYHRLALAALGIQFGEPLLQHGLLSEVVFVPGEGAGGTNPAARGAHTQGGALHDLPSAVALLCERPNDACGELRIVDARAACDALRAEAPSHFARLQRPFPSNGAGPSNDAGPISSAGGGTDERFPIVRTDPAFELRYERPRVEESARRAGSPLSQDDTAALDALDAVLARDEFSVALPFPGETLVFTDNRRRALAYGPCGCDDPAAAPRRLWRMWLGEPADLGDDASHAGEPQRAHELSNSSGS